MPIIRGNLFINGESPIEDISSNPHTITNTSVSVSTLVKKFLSSSIYFNGAANLSMAYSTDWAFGTEPFTIDFWYYNNSVNRASTVVAVGTLEGAANAQILFRHDFSNTRMWYIGIGGTNIGVNSVVDFTNTWMHIAVTRDSSNVLRIFFNGTQQYSAEHTNNVAPPGNLFLGGGIAEANGYLDTVGYIDNFRIVKGEALWTENFVTDALSAQYDMFYEVAPAEYVRPDRISKLYDINVNVRGAGKTCTRPTVSQYFHSPLYYFCQGFFPGTGLTGQAYATIAEADAHPLTINVGGLTAVNDTATDTYDFGDGTQLSYLTLDLSALPVGVEVGITVTSANGSVNMLTWDGVGDGSNHSVRVASSPGGNVTVEIKVLTIPDVIDPSVTINTPTTNLTYLTADSTVDLAGTATDNVGISSITWNNSAGGSGTATGTNSWTANGIALSAGENIITVTVTDTSNNTSSDTITVTRDNTNPTVTISSPTTDTTYTSETSSITLAGSASDNVSLASVSWVNSLGGSDTATGTTSWNAGTVNLSEGDNVITVTATDGVGNTGNDVITVSYSAEPQAEYPGYTISPIDTDWSAVEYNGTTYGTWDGTKWNSVTNPGGAGEDRIMLMYTGSETFTNVRVFHTCNVTASDPMLANAAGAMILWSTQPYVSEAEVTPSVPTALGLFHYSQANWSITKIEIS